MKATRLAFLAVLALGALSACAAKQKQSTAPVEQVAAPQPAQEEKAEPEISARLSDGDELSLVPIYFAFNSSQLLPQSLAQLQKMAKHLKANPGVSITIEGHCDERGTSEYNLALGEQRARATKQYLQTLGVAEERIRTLSFGEERPAVAGATEEAWSKNRRAEFVRSQS